MPSPPNNPRTSSPIKERLCAFGPPGIGKTHQYFVIAKWHQDLGSKAKFYGISTDGSYDVLSMNPEFVGLTNIDWENVETLQEYINAGKKFHKFLRPQDWMSVDLMNSAWAAAQDEYARQLAKDMGNELIDMGDLWLSEGPSGKYPIKGWDWGYPNARYRAFANNLVVGGLGHRFVVAAQKELMKESRTGDSDEDPEIKRVFKHIGLKPEGQKDMPFQFHTVLHIDAGHKNKTQTMATAKERYGYRRWWGIELQNGRVRDEPLKDFFLDYLVGTANWTMD